MLVTVAGMEMVTRPEPRKAPVSMVVIFDGMTMLARAVQPWKVKPTFPR